jgi:asparagine synthase (glutamine-hydrolysing)
MCGIVGWVDFARDLTPAQSVLTAMTNSLVNRGIDSQGVWLSRHAGLGHTRTAVIDPAGGLQPFVALVDGQPVAVISYNGEVYNFSQLRTELIARGHTFVTRSDTEVVIQAYLAWGHDCVRRLEGIFAFAIWDVRRSELFLARDRLGVKPLFVSRQPTGVVFGSEPKALLIHPEVSRVVNQDGLRELFATAKKPGMSIYQDLRALLPGHYWVVGRSGVQDRTYWELTVRDHPHDVPATVNHVGELLEDIVHRELQSDVPLCLALSGGIDSSTIATIAAHRQRQQRGEQVRTFVTTFEDYAANFRPDDVRFAPDEVFAAEVAASIQSEHIPIVLKSSDLMDASTRLAALTAQDAPTTLGDMDTSNYLTSQRIKEHSTVALSGEVADEIFGGYSWMFDEELLAAPVFPWVAKEFLQPGSPRGQGRGLFDRQFMANLDLNAYYADHFQEAISAAPVHDSDSPVERHMRQVSYVTLSWWLPMLLDRDDRLSMANALEMRVPFGDHRLVEYLYNTPWAMKTFDGREKSLLRAASRQLLPSSVLDRSKCPWPVTQDPAYAQLLRSELAAMRNNPSSPALPYLDLAAIDDAINNPSPISHEWISRMNVEMALQFNTWLTQYDISLSVSG